MKLIGIVGKTEKVPRDIRDDDSGKSLQVL